MTPRDPSTNEARFLRLFVKNEAGLRAYARTLLPTWEAVDDVLQNASIVIWSKLEQLNDDSGFLAWARVIVRFEALRARRKHARDRLVFDEDLTKLLADTAENLTEPEPLQCQHALKICLAKMRSKHRALLLAPYSSETSVKELAADSGVTPNSFYKLIGRLREKIIRCVEVEITGPSTPPPRADEA